MAKPNPYKGQRGVALLQSQGATAAQAEEQAQGSAPAIHGHAMSDVAGLGAALDAKLDAAGGEVTGDIEFSDDSTGIILTDRTTATQYRLYVDLGVLLIEAV